MTKSMLLITSYWGETKTFRLIPISKDCPYVEAIFDLHTGVLAVMGITTKDKVQMLPRLDDDGNPVQAKKPKANGNPFKEERRVMVQYPEYYLIDKSEMVDFVNMFAVNAETFNYMQYIDLANRKPSADDIVVPEKPAIVDATGAPLVKEG